MIPEDMTTEDARHLLRMTRNERHVMAANLVLADTLGGRFVTWPMVYNHLHQDEDASLHPDWALIIGEYDMARGRHRPRSAGEVAAFDLAVALVTEQPVDIPRLARDLDIDSLCVALQAIALAFGLQFDNINHAP